MPLISLPQTQQQTPAPALVAARLARVPQKMFEDLFKDWADGVRSIWTHPDPQAVLDALQAQLLVRGSSCKEVFDKSQQVAAFLESLQQGCTADTVALVRPFAVGEKGQITIAK